MGCKGRLYKHKGQCWTSVVSTVPFFKRVPMSCSHVLTMFACSSDVPLISHNVHMKFSLCSLVIPKLPCSSHSHYMECHNHSLRAVTKHDGQVLVHSIYLRRKVVCLFCLYLWDPPNWDTSDHVSWCLWKALEEDEGCIGLVSWHFWLAV